MKEQTDLELVRLARAGDKEAFGELVLRYQSLARSIAMHLVSQKETAYDLVQEAFLQAFLSLDRLKNPERFKSWLCGIVVNLCRSHIRDRETSLLSLESLTGGRQFSSLPLAEGETSPAETAEEHEFQSALLQAVKELSPDEREAVLYFYYDQLTLQEIGAIGHIPAGTVKVRLFRARQKLKENLLSRYSEIIPFRERRKVMMVRVTIADVVKKELKDKEGRVYSDYVVVLYDEKGNRVLPIWIGPAEGQAIAMGLTDFQAPRPMTYDFCAKLLASIDAKVEQVRIEALKGNTFFAVVRLKSGEIVREIDARPSDALNLAIRTRSPLLASEEVMLTAGIEIGRSVTAEQGGIKEIIKEIEGYQNKRPILPGQKLSKEELQKQNRAFIDSVFGS